MSIVKVAALPVFVEGPPKSKNVSNEATTWPVLVFWTLIWPVPIVVVPVPITCPVAWSKSIIFGVTPKGSSADHILGLNFTKKKIH